mgnify:CR=1 FL=1
MLLKFPWFQKPPRSYLLFFVPFWSMSRHDYLSVDLEELDEARCMFVHRHAWVVNDIHECGDFLGVVFEFPSNILKITLGFRIFMKARTTPRMKNMLVDEYIDRNQHLHQLRGILRKLSPKNYLWYEDLTTMYMLDNCCAHWLSLVRTPVLLITIALPCCKDTRAKC